MLRFVLSSIVLLAVAGLVAILGVLKYYGDRLPDYHQLAEYQPKVVTRIHAGDGELLAEFATERRVFVPIDAIPKRVSDAFISAEDKTFWTHNGIDLPGIVRAALTNLHNAGSDKRPIGASTITQQVARNFLLTNEVSISRKIKEIILSFRIEQAFTKKQILELYLNEIYLGHGSYGVAAAALTYFDKPLDELTLPEAAFLASLPKNPNKYFRERFHEAAIDRRNYVIGRMAEDGVITQDEAKAAEAAPLTLRSARETEFVTAGHFTEEVRRQLLAQYGAKGLYGGGLSVRTTLDPKLQGMAVQALRHGLVAYDERHGWRGIAGRLNGTGDWAKQLAGRALPDGADTWQYAAVLGITKDALEIGLKDGSRGVIRTADLRWAKPKPEDVAKIGDILLVERIDDGHEPAPESPRAEPAPKADPAKPDAKGKAKAATAAAPAPVAHYALRQMPEVNGALVALDPHTGRVLAMVGGFSYASSEFNRATQANRQPGSSFKPFVYEAALDSGYTPSSLVLDAPIEFSSGEGTWRPENYTHDFLGPTPLRIGLEKSRNAMTVRLASAIGMKKVVDYAEKFGIVDKMEPYLPMALGAGETTLLRLTTGYAMFVNGGKKITPTLIDRIQDRNGKTLYRHDERACPDCMNVGWADQKVPEIPDDRPQIQDPRTAFQMVQMLEGVVQRGTAKVVSSLHRPLAGKTGTTNDSKDVWFVGFSPDLVVGIFVGYDDPKTLGGHETGGSVAAPIFKSFMEVALADQPALPFRIPPGVHMVRVDAPTGRPAYGGDPNAIWEAYLPGTEPGTGGIVGDDGTLDPAEAAAAALKSANPAATTGTGGIY